VGLGQNSGAASLDVNEFDAKRVLMTRPKGCSVRLFFLAGTDGSWINRQVLPANGGMV